jgi:Fe-S-cluster containining protein
MLESSTHRITTEIASVGAQTQALAQRYEGVFVDLRRTLRDELARSPSLAQAAVTAMMIADAAADAFVAHLPNQPVRACRASCDACCHLCVMVPPGVAEAIVEHLADRLDPASLADLERELECAATAARATPDPSILRWRCPFLGAGGLCTIYEVRPPTCRAFTSTSAANCRSMAFDPAGGVAAIPQNPSPFRAYVEATRALEQTARQRGLPAHQLGLAEAVLTVLTASAPPSAQATAP